MPQAEKPPGASGYDHFGDFHFAREERREQRAGAAESEEGKFAWVAAALNCDFAYRADGPRDEDVDTPAAAWRTWSRARRCEPRGRRGSPPRRAAVPRQGSYPDQCSRGRGRHRWSSAPLLPCHSRWDPAPHRHFWVPREASPPRPRRSSLRRRRYSEYRRSGSVADNARGLLRAVRRDCRVRLRRYRAWFRRSRARTAGLDGAGGD